MKKNVGSVLSLYPTPAVVIGTMIDDNPTWLLAGHIGIIGHDRILISLFNKHFTNGGIIATRRLSVNVVDEALLPRADYVGIVSGLKVDKSEVFEWHLGEGQTPVIEDSPLVMECEVVDNYKTETFDNFICKITCTLVEDECLNENGKVDYNKLKPVLFEMPTYSYLRTGDVIGKCTTLGKDFAKAQK